MMCTKYGKECPFESVNGFSNCEFYGECPDEEFQEWTEDYLYESDIIEESKATMDICWKKFDEALKVGEDVELDDDYFQADTFLRSLGIIYDPEERSDK